MPDAIFAHPRLARVYDAFDGDRDDLAAYLRIARELGAERVLDVGCGTGCLAVRLADGGHTVVGVDPAAASLEVARSKDPAGRITWICGDATELPALGADLAVMTGNVAQVFLTEQDWTRTLRGVGAALRPGGYLVFETRRPERRAWLEWAADVAPVILDVPGSGLVEQRRAVTSVSLPLVRPRSTYRFLADGTVVTSESTLRFRSRQEVEASLADCSYRVLDVREAPDRPGREFVFVAEGVPVVLRQRPGREVDADLGSGHHAVAGLAPGAPSRVAPAATRRAGSRARALLRAAARRLPPAPEYLQPGARHHQ